MATKYYLDQEGLEKLVAYINDSLAQKAGKDDMPNLPDNLVTTDDLSNYVLSSALTDFIRTEDADAMKDDIAELQATAAMKTDLEDFVTADELERVEGLITGVYHFRGSVANLEALAAIEDPKEGDVYNLEDTGINAAWTGTEWDEFGTVVDLTPYLKVEDVGAITEDELNRIIYSGKTAIISDVKSLQAMLSNSEPEVTVTLDKDVAASGAITIPPGKKVTLDLDGNTLDLGSNSVTVNGKLVVEGDGEIDTSSWGLQAAGSQASVTINSGVIKAGEAGVTAQKGAKVTINGGTLESTDNAPIMGQGSTGNGDIEIVINGGTLVGHITSAGYTACGVYMPNSGKLTMNGGTIISDGAGIVMRAGEVVLNGGSIKAQGDADFVGKVGDSRIVVGSYAVVYDEKAKYPGASAGEFSLTIGEDMKLEGTAGDIQTILSDGAEANIIDNRVKKF